MEPCHQRPFSLQKKSFTVFVFYYEHQEHYNGDKLEVKNPVTCFRAWMAEDSCDIGGL